MDRRVEYFLLVMLFIGYSMFSWHTLPIQPVADEIQILKSTYESINARSLRLQSWSPYSAWVSIYCIPAVIFHWSVYWLFHMEVDFNTLKRIIFSEYQYALITLRLFTSAMFFWSLTRIKIIADKLIGQPYGFWLIYIIAGNLLIFAQAHTIKHWISGHTVYFIGLYYLFNGYYEDKFLIRMFGAILITIGILMLPVCVLYMPIIFFGLASDKNSISFKIKFIINCVIGALMITVVTYFLGFGSNSSDGVSGKILFYFHPKNFYGYINAFLNVSPHAIVLMIGSLLLILLRKSLLSTTYLVTCIFVFVICLAFLCFFGTYGNYYVMLLYFSSAPIMAVFPYVIFVKYKKLYKYILFAFSAIIFLQIILFSKIILNGDSRIDAINWIYLNENNKKNFYIYDTIGVSYLPISKNTVEFLYKNYPTLIGVRERNSIQNSDQYNIDGYHLWKITYSGFGVDGFVKTLIKDGFNVYLMREKFGSESNIQEKNSKILDDLNKDFVVKNIKIISPYKNESENDIGVGDIIYDFANTYNNLTRIEKTGPLINIYKVELK